MPKIQVSRGGIWADLLQVSIGRDRLERQNTPRRGVSLPQHSPAGMGECINGHFLQDWHSYAPISKGRPMETSGSHLCNRLDRDGSISRPGTLALLWARPESDRSC